MSPWVYVGLGACGVLAIMLGLLLLFRQKTPIATGAPTPAEEQIKAETQRTAGEIAAEGERKAKETANESKSEVVDNVRDLVVRGRLRK